MGEDGEVRFHEACELEPGHWEDLQRIVQRRVLRYFRRHELLDEATTADMLSWQVAGGFSIDASVRVDGHDRHGVERLVRYCARPPFALERLHALEGPSSLASPDARLLYRLPKPTPEGRTALHVTPLELLERLARLIPPPRIHRHRYHGVLAPNARLRARVVGMGRGETTEDAAPQVSTEEAGAEGALTGSSDPPPRSRSPSRIPWARLLARIYQILPLLCPSCGGQTRIVSFLTEPATVQRILLHLDLPHRPPPVAPARDPPQGDFLLDQSPAFDPTEPEPVPEYEFDQSVPDEFGD